MCSHGAGKTIWQDTSRWVESRLLAFGSRFSAGPAKPNFVGVGVLLAPLGFEMYKTRFVVLFLSVSYLFRFSVSWLLNFSVSRLSRFSVTALQVH